MGWFRLKAGSHTVGLGNEQRFIKAGAGPDSLVESDEDLAKQDPARWEMAEAPTVGDEGEPEPPPPTHHPLDRTDADRFQHESVTGGKKAADAHRASRPEYKTNFDSEPELAEGQSAKQSLRAAEEGESPPPPQRPPQGESPQAKALREQQQRAQAARQEAAPRPAQPGAPPAQAQQTREQQQARAEALAREAEAGADDGLDAMNMDDLRKEAQAAKIEVRPTMKKTEVVSAIRNARKK